uniref:Uncharacterized protein n=1 Tax=Sphaerodactylus townsendi TaxID=933632 RepID=A0ACB8G0J9_9SAUR
MVILNARFGKKKEDKGAKGDQKGNAKHGTLKEEDVEKMKEERERLVAVSVAGGNTFCANGIVGKQCLKGEMAQAGGADCDHVLGERETKAGARSERDP